MNELVERFMHEKVNDAYKPIVAKFRAFIKKKFPHLKEEMRGGTEKYHSVPVYRNKRIILTLSPTQSKSGSATVSASSIKQSFATRIFSLS